MYEFGRSNTRLDYGVFHGRLVHTRVAVRAELRTKYRSVDREIEGTHVEGVETFVALPLIVRGTSLHPVGSAAVPVEAGGEMACYGFTAGFEWCF